MTPDPSSAPRSLDTPRDPSEIEAEAQTIHAVCDRLVGRFTDLDPAQVAAVVDQEYERLGGPIRSFVPILVEKAATARLAQSADFGLIA